MFCFAFLGIISQLAEPHVRTIRYEFINSKQTTNRLSTYLLLSSLESCSKIQKRPIFETSKCFWIYSFNAEALKKQEQINVRVGGRLWSNHMHILLHYFFLFFVNGVLFAQCQRQKLKNYLRDAVSIYFIIHFRKYQ